MNRTALLWLALSAVAVLAVAGEVLRLRATNRRWIRAGRVPGWRWWRALVVRFSLWFLSWPHALDRILRTDRVPATATVPEEVASWAGGRLYRYGPGQSPERPILIVHSLVTEPWILDLAPGLSMVEALTADGRDVYLLDWGQPSRDTAEQGLADKAWLVRTAVDHISTRHDDGDVHVLGYCSGGTVALITTAADPSRIASLALIAPMVDAAVPGGMRPILASRWLFPALLLDQGGCVPAAAVREAFHLLRPMALRAARQRWRLRGDPSASRIAGALTRWTWEQRRLPGGVFFDLIDFYRLNPLIDAGGWELSGRTIDLRDIRTPTLVAVSDRDHIVPIGSSLALTHLVSGPVEVTRCAGGHVSMVAGAESQSTLYPSLRRWFARDVDAESYSEVGTAPPERQPR